MDIELYPHNLEAYEKVTNMFENVDRCCVVHPTGTGKSYIALKWFLDNKDKKQLLVTSLKAIKYQIEETIKENGLSLERDFPNLKIITYRELLTTDYEHFDMIVLDEFHRAGAPKWGEAVNALLEYNKNAKVLGLSATPVRYLDGKRDMSDEIFDGNVASHIALDYAIAEGILPPPKYINAIYSFKEDIDRLEEKIEKLSDEAEKKELKEKLLLAKRTIENAENLPDLFEKYMVNRRGKYLVFCRDIKHLEEMEKETYEWFSKVNKDIDVYHIHSEEKDEENDYVFGRFNTTNHYFNKDKLKLLYSVGMLNEGVHLNEIDGVIMLRRTSSPILYQQQLGRGLTTGKNNKPLIFDVVNNIECLKDIENLKVAVLSTMRSRGKTKDEILRMEEVFSIVDDYKEISDLIKELDIEATYGWDKKYELLKNYLNTHNGEFPPYKEPIIGNWFSRQKTKLSGENLTEEQQRRVELLDELGDWRTKKNVIVNTQSWEEKYELLKEYVNAHNGEFPPYKEPIIGTWFKHQRELLKQENLTEEQQRRVELLDELGDWSKTKIDTDNEIWQEKYNLLKEYVETHNGEFPPYREPIIGNWFSEQKTKLSGENLTEEQQRRKQLLDELGDWTKTKVNIDNEIWQEKYNLLKEYVETHNGEFPPYKEPIIGTWFKHQKNRLGELEIENLTEEQQRRIELLDELGDWRKKSRVIVNTQSWEEKYELLKEYVKTHNGEFPSQKEPIIGHWFSNQRTLFKNEELEFEKIELLDELGDWLKGRKVTDAENWQEKYELLKEYVEIHNGEFPPVKEPIIGAWFDKQKVRLTKENLTEEQQRKAKLLDELGEWRKKKFVKVNIQSWGKKYNLLKEYVEIHNGEFPPQREPIIGAWYGYQKQLFRKKELDPEKVELLNKLGNGNWAERKRKVKNIKSLLDDDKKDKKRLN